LHNNPYSPGFTIWTSSSFSAHSYGYEPSSELKPVLKHPVFHFSAYGPADFWEEFVPRAVAELMKKWDVPARLRARRALSCSSGHAA
jgi:hypothetical protein